MAKRYFVTATFKDHEGGTSTIRLNNPPGLTNFMTMDDAKDYAKGIAKWSRAGLVSYSSGCSEVVDEYPDGFGVATTMEGEHYDKVQQKLVVYYRHKPSGKVIQTTIPAPADKCFSDQRPKTDLLEDLADLIAKASNYASSELNPIKGGLRSKLPKQDDFLIKTGV